METRADLRIVPRNLISVCATSPFGRRQSGVASGGLAVAVALAGQLGLLSLAEATPVYHIGCYQQMFGAADQNCTANDVRLGSVTPTVVDGCISSNDTASITFRTDLLATAQSKYDIGIWVNTDGGSVFTNAGGSGTTTEPCIGTFLSPVTTGNPNLTGGYGPYRSLDGNPGDKCGDLTQGETNVVVFGEETGATGPSDLVPLTISCKNVGGVVQFDTLVTWGQSQNEKVCNSATPDQNLLTALPAGTSSKCTHEVKSVGLLSPELSITKTCKDTVPAPNGDGKAYAGEALNCTITVSNVSATVTANNIYVVDDFPEDLVGNPTNYVASQGTTVKPVNAGGYVSPYEGPTGSYFLWKIGSIPPSSTKTLTFSMVVRDTYPNQFSGSCNKAQLAMDNNGDDVINLWRDAPLPNTPPSCGSSPSVGCNDPCNEPVPDYGFPPAGAGCAAGVSYRSGELQGTGDPEKGDWVVAGGNTCSILTPAQVSEFRAVRRGQDVLAQWDTSSEAGAAGYHLERMDPDTGEFLPVNERLLPVNLLAPQGSHYELLDTGVAPQGSLTYRLIEETTTGGVETHGPFSVQVEAGGVRSDRVAALARDLGPPDVTTEQGRFSARGHAMSARMEARLEAAAEASDREASAKKGPAAALAAAKAGNDRVKIAVRGNGLYSLSTADIAAALGLSQTAVQQGIQNRPWSLTNRGQPVAWQSVSNGLAFYGRALAEPDRNFALDNVYWLQSGTGVVMTSAKGQKLAAAPATATFMERLDLEQDLEPAPAAGANSNDDFWYWGYVLGQAGSSASFAFDAPGAASGAGQIALRLEGFQATADNAVTVSLNGKALGSARWSGEAPYSQTFQVGAGLLKETGNSLTVSANLADQNVKFSYVLVDGFELAYPRRYQAQDNRLWFRGDGNPVVTVGGFASSAIQVFDLSAAERPQPVQGLSVTQNGATWQVSLAPKTATTPYFAVAGGAAAPLAISGTRVRDLRNPAAGGDFILVTAPELWDAAQAYAGYRQSQGLQVLVATYPEIVDAFNDGIPSPYAVQRFLRHAWETSGGRTGYALIAGAGTFDYRDIWGKGGNLVPPLLVGTAYGLYAGDNLLADVAGDDGLPELPIGRIPVLSAAELTAYLTKVQAYENSAAGDWQKRALMIADDGTWPDFASASGELAALLPEYSLYQAYQGWWKDPADPSKPYDPWAAAAATRQKIIGAINDGVGLVNYLGHGGVINLAYPRLMEMADVAGLANGAMTPVMLGLTCNVARFDLPGVESLASALVLHERGGAIAFWGPTHFSNHGKAGSLASAFVEAMEGGERVLGRAVLGALREMGVDPMGMHSTYSIIGDPAIRVR